MTKKKKKAPSVAPVQAQLLKFLKKEPRKQFSKKDIFRKFIREYSKQEIGEALDELSEKGQIVYSGSKLHLPFSEKKFAGKNNHVYEGKVDMTKHGYAFISTKELEHDVFVSSARLNRALDGDIVKVAILKTRPSGKIDGEVVQIVKRANTIFLGTVHVSKKFAFLIPDRRNMLHDIFIPLDKLNNAKDGDKAVAIITEWPLESKSPVGEITEIIGESGRNDVEMRSILIENGFPLQFSEEAIREAEEIPEEISEEEIKKRRDFRAVPTLTIDPDDAKDFDDALSLQRLPNGNLEVGVHIADVTHYVRPGSALDEDAQERATSVYLVDRVLPMLPEKISNKVCSLRPDEDKLCFSVTFEMNERAKVLEVWYGKTIIRSQKRFTYREAKETLDSSSGVFAGELHLLNKLAQQLRKERIKNGSIPFETSEVRFKLDEKARPVDVVVKEMTEANWLIEDFMLLANRYVAKYVSKLRHGKRQIPFVYRVHDRPDMVKLEQFSEFAKNFGYNIKFSDPEEIADQLNRLIEMVRGKKEQDVIEQIAIRSMAKAIYSTKNIGHFGLAFDYYSHFTSPIRRYPDVLAHRILQHCLETGGEELYAQEPLQILCDHTSQKERDAMTAERESVKYKMVEFMSDKIGQEFDGIISGVVYKGIYVELVENKCEGFIHLKYLGGADFEFDESNYCLIDREDGTRYRLGDSIRVRVLETNLENRTIDFELAD